MSGPPATLDAALGAYDLRLAVVVIWLPFIAAPVIGYMFLGWLGALVPLALYAACGLSFVLMWRSPRARKLVEEPEIDISDPRWRNLMP